MINREEIDSMWERIKALEWNNLKISKALAKQSVLSIFGLMGVVAATEGKKDTFIAYMGPRGNEIEKLIGKSKGIDEVIEIVEKFNKDCVEFTGALLE